jgi:phosphate transport system substrate-binding protein
MNLLGDFRVLSKTVTVRETQSTRRVVMSFWKKSARISLGNLLLVFLVTLCFLAPEAGNVNAASEVESITGAGATFPYPVYAKWATKYNQNTGLKLTYQAIGSGGGIAQIKAKTVDFGASDEPLKAEELDKTGLVQFPMIMGGVVQVVNIEGIGKGKLKLTGDLLADIFLGKIKNWNDRRIMAVNPDLKLPDREITVVHRADGSGTTWIFTNYLSKVSAEWKEKVGNDKSVSWPTGVGGKGNEGVAAVVKKTEGAIGYVEYAYALRERLKYVQLQNKAGRFVTPTIETFQAAAANADWDEAPGFFMVLTDQSGEKSWPIVGASYILVYKDQPDPAKAKAVLKFFDWSFKNGADLASDLHYVPIPSKVYTLVHSRWQKEITSGGMPVWK